MERTEEQAAVLQTLAVLRARIDYQGHLLGAVKAVLGERVGRVQMEQFSDSALEFSKNAYHKIMADVEDMTFIEALQKLAEANEQDDDEAE